MHAFPPQLFQESVNPTGGIRGSTEGNGALSELQEDNSLLVPCYFSESRAKTTEVLSEEWLAEKSGEIHRIPCYFPALEQILRILGRIRCFRESNSKNPPLFSLFYCFLLLDFSSAF